MEKVKKMTYKQYHWKYQKKDTDGNQKDLQLRIPLTEVKNDWRESKADVSRRQQVNGN